MTDETYRAYREGFLAGIIFTVLLYVLFGLGVFAGWQIRPVWGEAKSGGCGVGDSE